MSTKNKHAQALGKLGGKAGRGKSKARETARKAAIARWSNRSFVGYTVRVDSAGRVTVRTPKGYIVATSRGEQNVAALLKQFPGATVDDRRKKLDTKRAKPLKPLL